MFLEIPDDVAKQLQERAIALGAPPEQVAIGAIRKSLAREGLLAERLGPIREAFRQSGMTEDEAVDCFEAEKHAMRRGN